MTITASQTFSIEEYLELEALSRSKHEYHNGKIIDMAGGTSTHNQLTMTIGAEILIAIRQQDKIFHLYSGDMKIRIDKQNSFVYPDAVTVAIRPEYYQNRRDIITNPLLVVEVSSSSTEAYDKGEKFNLYRSISSFQEYVVLSQDQHWVSRYFREGPDLWRTFDYYSLEELIPLQSMDIQISMAGIYKGVELSV
jgi:Uma2 family endonuclease